MQRNARTCIITHYNRDTHAFIRRRVRVADPDAILQLRLPPPPLPLSWGKAIKPYRPAVVQQVQHAPVTSSGPPAAAAEAAAASAAAADEGVGQAAAAAAVPCAPRGLIHQPPALPASRNCEPRVHRPTSSSSSSSPTAGEQELNPTEPSSSLTLRKCCAACCTTR